MLDARVSDLSVTLHGMERFVPVVSAVEHRAQHPVGVLYCLMQRPERKRLINPEDAVLSKLDHLEASAAACSVSASLYDWPPDKRRFKTPAKCLQAPYEAACGHFAGVLGHFQIRRQSTSVAE